MLTIKDGKVVELTHPTQIFGNISTSPYDIGARSEELLPAGCPIMTSIFVVDKVDVCFCDGNDQWYLEADKSVAAGQPISALF